MQIYEPGEDDPISPPDNEPPTDDVVDPIPAKPADDEMVVDGEPPDISIRPGGARQRKVYVDGVAVSIMDERVEFLDEYGKLHTESLRDFSKRALKQRFVSLDDFLKRWDASDRKQAIIEELQDEAVFLAPLAEEVGRDLDPFDLICYVAFNQPPLTRRERADNVRKRDVFTKYGAQARAVLEALLQKYQDQGVINLDDPRVLQIAPFDTMGTPVELIKRFGSRLEFVRAVHDLQSALYKRPA